MKKIALAAVLGMTLNAFGAPWLPNLSTGMKMNPLPSVWDDPVQRGRTPVLVYVANDFSPSFAGAIGKSQRHLLAALRDTAGLTSDEATFLTQTADTLEQDWDRFRRAVDTETRTLMTELCRPNPQFNAGLAIFRNSGQTPVTDKFDTTSFWDHCGPVPTSSVVQRELWTLPAGTNQLFAKEPAWADQPLAHTRLFEAATEELQRVFPPEKHRYLFILKGHGDADTALALDHPTLTSAIAPNLLRQAVLKVRSSGATARGLVSRVNQALAALAPKGPSGLSKAELLRVIQKVGWHPEIGGYTPILLLDANDGALEIATDPQIAGFPKPGNYEALHILNIGLWFHLTGDAGYEPMPYHRLFELFGLPGKFERDLQDRLHWFLTVLRTAP